MTNIVQAKLDARDAKHLDPAERAELVNSFLFAALGLESATDLAQNPVLHWDIICFCSQMLVVFAMSNKDMEFIELIKVLNSQIMGIHYSVDDDHEILGSDGKTHMAEWIQRIEDYV